MKYLQIKGLNKPVSKLVFGTATPILFKAVASGATAEDKEKAFQLLDRVFDNGINTFDCAAHYGEVIMGEWMSSRKNRDKCVIITKGAHPNKWRDRVTDYDILSDANDSLKKLQTDKIDIYMLHRDSHTFPVKPIMDSLQRLYDEDKIAVFGGSNWTHERIEEANIYAEKNSMQKMMVSSPNFGLAEQVADPWAADAKFADPCVTISGPQNKEARAWYQKNNIPVFAYSSMARGFFSGRFKSNEPEKAKELLDGPGISGYFCDNNFERLKRCEVLAKEKDVTVAQIAIAWIFNQPLNVAALSSPVTAEQLSQNIEALNISLSDAEVKWLNLEK